MPDHSTQSMFIESSCNSVPKEHLKSTLDVFQQLIFSSNFSSSLSYKMRVYFPLRTKEADSFHLSRVVCVSPLQPSPVPSTEPLAPR